MNDLNRQIDTFYSKILDLLKSAHKTVYQSVNSTMVQTYYKIGRLIVDEEQQGKEKAKYGQNLINALSKRLSDEFGKGFSATNLKQMRSFYLTYSKGQTVSDEFRLSWSHYLKLMRIDDENERKFYEIESIKNNWSNSELQRQLDSALYTRLSLSRNKSEVLELSAKGLVIEKPKDAIKDPFILEFLGLPEKSVYSESDLEQKLIDKLEHFLLELGTGFTFVARQKRISFDDKHFRIDLVFYNRILKSFVLIDLKIGELKHQDIGQMQMYVNYYDREIRLKDENKTIGLILCQNKSESVVQYTLPENNEQIFASKYQTVLPSKEKLKELIENKE
ncbi:MAG: PDDEXK nuclease domain-containing protein [Bacteroidales bacterium]|nr:PDDEXK nuclease domain-containing protein [Bacteroidales bacterium]